MTGQNQDEWIDIDEAVALTGKRRETLMRWKRDGKVVAKTEETEFTQRQRRTLFRRADLIPSEQS